jgi:hypothetical protein
VNFDHLDDAAPVEPDSSTRAAVARRARRLRQRRAIVPGAALLAVAGAAIVAITMLSNESSVPTRVVAGPTTTTVDADPIGAAVTRGAIHVEASIASAAVGPGAAVPVAVSVQSSILRPRPFVPVQVCVVTPPFGRGWTGYGPDRQQCPARSLPVGGGTTTVRLVAPTRAGDYAVFLRWSPAPSGDFLPIPLRVVRVVPSVP